MSFHTPTFTVNTVCATYKGSRPENQDRIMWSKFTTTYGEVHFGLLADGHCSSEVSEMLKNEVPFLFETFLCTNARAHPDILVNDIVIRTYKQVNENVVKIYEERGLKGGSTLLCTASFVGLNRCFVLNIGNSRCMVIDADTRLIFRGLRRRVDLETALDFSVDGAQLGPMATFSHIIYGDVKAASPVMEDKVSSPDSALHSDSESTEVYRLDPADYAMENDPTGAGLREFLLLLRNTCQGEALESVLRDRASAKSFGQRFLTRSIGDDFFEHGHRMHKTLSLGEVYVCDLDYKKNLLLYVGSGTIESQVPAKHIPGYLLSCKEVLKSKLWDDNDVVKIGCEHSYRNWRRKKGVSDFPAEPNVRKRLQWMQQFTVLAGEDILPDVGFCRILYSAVDWMLKEVIEHVQEPVVNSLNFRINFLINAATVQVTTGNMSALLTGFFSNQ